MADPHDLALRRAALDRVRQLQTRYDDLIPLEALKLGFEYDGRRLSFGSFYVGIYRSAAQAGPAALCLVTAAPKAGRPAPYEDAFDDDRQEFSYRFRDPQKDTREARRAADADNRALIEAHRLGVPLIYFRGIAPGQYAVVAPVVITGVDEVARLVRFQATLPIADTSERGVVSAPETRRYATREAVYRLHQHRFRAAVLRAYSSRCAVCSLREASLLEASHIIEDRDPRGEATVVNGISLCAIHHLAYDRNLMGIDPEGVVHIAGRLLQEIDGPMLKSGLQEFHGARILAPRRVDERPDPRRLEVRFERFEQVA